MDPRQLTGAVGIVLFAGLSLLVITLYRLTFRFRPPPAPPLPPPTPPAKPRDSLTTDPKLMAFFKAVDPQFRQPAPPIAPAHVPPIVTSAAPALDADLAAIVQIWSTLSPRARRELRRLAEMKRDNA